MLRFLIESVNADTVIGYVNAHPEYDLFKIVDSDGDENIYDSETTVSLFGKCIVDSAVFSYKSIPTLFII